MNILTPADVKAAFAAAGVGNQNLGTATIDDVLPRFRVQTYAELKEDWLVNGYVLWFNNWLKTWGAGNWEDWFNCECFAQLFAAGLRISHKLAMDALPPGAPTAEAPAAFESWGTNYPGVNGSHAVIAAIVEGGKPVWLEPQITPAVKIYPMTAANAAAVFYLL